MLSSKNLITDECLYKYFILLGFFSEECNIENATSIINVLEIPKKR
jgi:hypothetical protein